MENKFQITTSWDDGGVLDLKIATYLEQCNLTGTFYIILDKVGQDGFLNWDQIKYLDQRGFEIGSHTMSHPSDLKMLHDEQLHYEIQNSKDILETVLGHTIKKFCYPRGRFDDRVKAKVKESGYEEARTTGTPGILEKSDIYAVPGTIHIYDRKEYGGKSIIEFSKETIDKAKQQGGYINIWGHSQEINKYKLWNVLEEVLSYASSAINQ